MCGAQAPRVRTFSLTPALVCWERGFGDGYSEGDGDAEVVGGGLDVGTLGLAECGEVAVCAAGMPWGRPQAGSAAIQLGRVNPSRFRGRAGVVALQGAWIRVWATGGARPIRVCGVREVEGR